MRYHTHMIKHNQNGAVSGLALSLGMAIVLLIAALGFGGWAFTSRQDYKNNTDQKVNDAVVIAKQREGTRKDAQFAQDEKNPLRTYKGPDAYGSLSIQYPKTWSGFIDDTGKSGDKLVDGFFYPGVVPSTTNQASVFALRVQVVSQAYSDVVNSLSQNSDPASIPVITPFALPKVPKAVGIKYVGKLPNQKQGEMVVLPLRSQTLEVWSETAQFAPDFEANILPNFSFLP